MLTASVFGLHLTIACKKRGEIVSMDFMEQLIAKAKSTPKKIVFPESTEQKILAAARRIVDQGICTPVLIGQAEELESVASAFNISLEGMEIVQITDNVLDAYAKEYAATSKKPVSEEDARKFLSRPVNFAAMMVKVGDADSFIAGLSHATKDVILAGYKILGMQEGIKTFSSIFLMRIPNYEGPEGELLVFADCAVNPDPNPEQLADIAIATAGTTQDLLGWEPRVAMLSFSTKSSAQHCRIDKVTDAMQIVQERRPDIKIDGDLQLDAAIVPSVAARKVPGDSPVAGKANVLIFPDLDAGNIAYKMVQRLANADAYGPLLQGFAKPICDLSRGSEVEDIVGATIMTVVRTQASKPLVTN